MKTLFFGTPPFAAKVLTILLERGVNIVGVISKPDKPKGRSAALIPTPVKEEALAHNLPLFQPEKASDPLFFPLLASLEPDLIVVVAYGEILRENILTLPHKACINLHASLLPRYRGAAPIQRAIIDGEKETGVSIIHMAKKMDAGDLLAVEKVEIGPEETYGELQERLCTVGSDLLFQVIEQFEKGVPIATPQEESLVTFAPKIELEECRIDWNLPAAAIANLVRGVNPQPGAWTTMKLRGEQKRLKVFEALPLDAPSKEALAVRCGDGRHLELKIVQPEGKQRMEGRALLRGIGKEVFTLE